jgi:hypothetical protein
MNKYLRYGTMDAGYEEGSRKKYLSYNGPVNPALAQNSPSGSGSYSAVT